MKRHWLSWSWFPATTGCPRTPRHGGTMRLSRLLSVALVSVVLPLALASCGGDSGSGPETFTVAISPGTAQLATGSNTTLIARVTDGSGATVAGQSFT